MGDVIMTVLVPMPVCSPDGMRRISTSGLFQHTVQSACCMHTPCRYGICLLRQEPRTFMLLRSLFEIWPCRYTLSPMRQ